MTMNTLPVIKRARDYYLYDFKGKRYLDLFQDRGRAVLGHRPAKISEIIKNTISRGLTAPYPTIYQNRLIKTLQRFFPENGCIVICPDQPSLLKILALDTPLSDPALGESGKALLWRPFTAAPVKGDILVPVIPVPGLAGFQIACVTPDSGRTFPEASLLPPVVSAAAVKVLYHLFLIERKDDPSFLSGLDSLSCLKRDGIYIKLLIDNGRYSLLFEEALEKGVLLPPKKEFPCIIPAVLSDNEKKTILNLFKG